MLRNFKLTIEYEGTEFNGWQTQSPDLRTIQNHFEEKLQKIFKVRVHCMASGRTDSRVHALGQVVNFKADTDMKPDLIIKALNAFLDRDISVVSIEEVPLSFNACLSAKQKTYRYTILNREYPSAIARNHAYFYPQKLNLAAMRYAAKALKGKQDFKVFQSAAQRMKRENTVRTISKINVIKDGDFIHVEITADGFLYKMVRNIVGTLLAIGSGKIPKDSIPQLIKSKDNIKAPSPVPGYGLCLMSVRY